MKGGSFLRVWKKDLRVGVLVLLLLSVSVLPWFWYGMACMKERQEEPVAAMSGVGGPYVSLTFDDGPRQDTTPTLLDGLAERGVHATFFIIGTRIEGREDILRRMAAEGHQIGLHSQNHKKLSGLSCAELTSEVEELRQTLEALLGQRDYMLRPPYGLTSSTLCSWATEPLILWSVDPQDWADHNSARQVKAIVSKAKDGDIILLHDIYHASVDTALQVVDALMDKGFYFVTVEELFAIRGITPEAGCIYHSLPPKDDGN